MFNRQFLLDLQLHDLASRFLVIVKNFFVLLINNTIKKVCIQMLGRSISSKNLLHELASLRLGHWWLIFNQYKLTYFCFFYDLY